MADAAPPAPKKSGPGRWILLGCGCLGILLVLGLAAIGGIFYFVYEGTTPVANEGLLYLSADRMREAFGPRYGVHRDLLGWNVQVTNDRGNARIEYTVRDDRQQAVGHATVWLVKSAGKWSGVGARVTPTKGQEFTIGTPPKEHHRVDWD